MCVCHQVKSSVNKLFSLGSVSVRYTPKTTGAHELNILHKGAPLQVKNNRKKKFFQGSNSLKWSI